MAASIGVELGTTGEGTAAAFVAAGLLSVILFPAASLVLLRRGEKASPSPQPVPIGAADAAR